MDLSLHDLNFTQPLCADLLTGKVYAIPRQRWSAESDGVSIQQIPICDSPVSIAERAAAPLKSFGLEPLKPTKP